MEKEEGKNKEELCVAPARLKLESPRQARDRLASELQILTASDGYSNFIYLSEGKLI